MKIKRPELFEIYWNQYPRLRLFYLLIGTLLLVLLAMLAYRQIIRGGDYREQESRQSLRRILLPGPRGNIYDRNGTLLVGNRPQFSAVVYLGELRPEFKSEYIELVREARRTNTRTTRDELNVRARHAVVQSYLDQINRILKNDARVDRGDVERHFKQNLLLPFPLIKDLKPEEYAKLIELIPVEAPIQIHTDSARYYPFDSAASHTLGFVSSTFEVPQGDLPGAELTTISFKGKTGRTGLERSFNATMQGNTGMEIWVVDPSGFQYKRTALSLPGKGDNIRASIDIQLQTVAEAALGERVGGVAAIDVETGEILVLASKPDFNLNDLSPYITHETYRSISARGAWLNRALAGLYPPGSAFKVVVACAGLEAGVIRNDTEVNCSGSYRIAARSFSCNNHADRGPIKLERAILKSCNVFFYDTGVQIGVDKISEVAIRFGLGHPTGISLPGETTRMLVPTRKWKQRRWQDRWYRGDTANLAIGQGYLRVTPLQLACFAASFSRRETRTKPSLTHDPTRAYRPIDHGGEPLPLTESQYLRIVSGMEQSIQLGSGRLGRMPGLRIAGKTGTPQIRSDNKTLNLGVFIAFAPVEAPKIALAVVVEEVSEDQGYSGGLTAAPIGRAIFEAYFGRRSTAYLGTPAR